MKKISILLAAALLTFSHCRKENGDLVGSWTALSIKNLDTNEELTDPLMLLSSVRTQSIILDFEDNGGSGSISGKIGPNTAQAAYRLGSNKRIEMTPIGGSKIGDASVFNNRFRNDFPLVNRYEFEENGEVLVLWYNNNRQRITLIKS
jgi:hypothetical protein